MTTKRLSTRQSYIRILLPEFGRSVGGLMTPTANRCYYIPFYIPHRIVIECMFFYTSSANAQNSYIALFNSAAYKPTSRIAVSGNVAWTGTQVMQKLNFANPVTLEAGLYFAAVVMENANANGACRYVGDTVWLKGADGVRAAYYYEDMGSYISPPATATPVNLETDSLTVYAMLGVHNPP